MMLTGTDATTNGVGHTLSDNWKRGDPCKWRYRHKKRWQNSHVLGVRSDKDGSVEVWDTRTGFPAYVPDRSECIKRRK